MVLVLFVAWSFVFFGMIKGIKSSGKVMYFATSFPYVVLIAFFIRAMLLDGAADGVAYMFSPHVSLVICIELTACKTRWEFASKPSERPTHSLCCDVQKYLLSTVTSAIIQKYLIMEPPEK